MGQPGPDDHRGRRRRCSPASPATSTRCTPTRSSPRRRSSAGGSSTDRACSPIATGLESRLGIKEGTAIAFLGMTWNLKAAVRIGDTIHVHQTVAATRPTSKARPGHRHLRRRGAEPARRGVPGRAVGRDVPAGGRRRDGERPSTSVLSAQAAARPDAAGRGRRHDEPDLRRARRARRARIAGQLAARRRSGRVDRVVLVADNSVRPPRRGLRGLAGRRHARDDLPVVDGRRAGVRHRQRRAALVVERLEDRCWRTAAGRPRPAVPVRRARRRGRARRPARRGSRVPAPPPLDPDALALICYTSGSTSRPKAVMHTHAGLLAAAAVVRPRLAPRAARRHPRRPAVGLGVRAGDDVDGDAGRRRPGAARSPAASPTAMLRALVDHRVTFFAGVTTMFVKMVGALEASDEPARPSRRPAAVHLRRRAAQRGRLRPLAGADRLPGARRLRRVRVLPASSPTTRTRIREPRARLGRTGRRRGGAAGGRRRRATTCPRASPARRGRAARR